VRREPVVLGFGIGRWRILYDVVMVVLALTVVALLIADETPVTTLINSVVYGIFVIDYFLRLALSTDRRRFVRANVVDLLAILPADQFRALRVLRVLRFLRIVRAGSILARVTRDVRGVAATNGLSWVLIVAVGVIAVSGAAVYFVEPGIDRWGDAMWWAVVTATTVGYGDVAPETGAARVIAVLLMLVGIGTIGMLTGSIATFFLTDDATPPSSTPHLEHLQAMIARWEVLSAQDRRAAAALLWALADPPTSGAPTPEGTGAPRIEPDGSIDTSDQRNAMGS
jgi:voltage-gated potassium channel